MDGWAADPAEFKGPTTADGQCAGSVQAVCRRGWLGMAAQVTDTHSDFTGTCSNMVLHCM